MARRSFGQRTARVGSQARLTEWGAFEVAIRFVGLGTSATAGAQSVGAIAAERLTLIRLRGHGFFHLDAGAAADSMIVAIGLIIVPTEARTAGVGSVPTPLSDMEAPWIWHEIFTLGPAVSATDDGGDLSRNVQFAIDGKAMRKFRTDEELTFIAEAEIVAGSPTCDGAAVVRQLFKLT